MLKAVVIQHVAFEDLGSFASVLKDHRFEVTSILSPIADPKEIALLQADLVVVSGGPLSVNDTGDFPFLDSELALLRSRLEARLPTMGICLGAQLMAVALGSQVRPGARAEIGWRP